MARVLGTPGWYVSEQSVSKYRGQFLVITTAAAFSSFASGVFFGMWLAGKNAYYYIFAGLAVLLLPLISRKIDAIVDKLERDRLSFRKGAVGEAVVGRVLEELPDSFFVVHDLDTGCGNMDHLVVGPTGVYAIETKNWKGVVAADGKGELLLNGRPAGREIKNFTRRMKVKALSSLDDLFVTGVLAFPSARVEAAWAPRDRCTASGRSGCAITSSEGAGRSLNAGRSRPSPTPSPPWQG